MFPMAKNNPAKANEKKLTGILASPKISEIISTSNELKVVQKKFNCQGFDREYLAVNLPTIVCKPKTKEANQMIRVNDIRSIIHQGISSFLRV